MYIDPGYESHVVVLEQLMGQALVSNAQIFPLIPFRQLSVHSLSVYCQLQIQLRCSVNSGLVCTLQG